MAKPSLGEGTKRRLISDEPDGPERVGEPAMSVSTPRSVMVAHQVSVASPTAMARVNERIRIADEDLHAECRGADLG